MSAEPVFDRTPTSCNVAWQICALVRFCNCSLPSSFLVYTGATRAQLELDSFFSSVVTWAERLPLIRRPVLVSLAAPFSA